MSFYVKPFPKRELLSVDDRHLGRIDSDHNEKTEGRKMMDLKLATHLETVSKLHNSLKSKILSRHNEF